MEQRCHIGMIWLTWIGLPILAVVVAWRRGWFIGLVVLAVGVLAQVLYVRLFPHLSRFMGYGAVRDTAAAPDDLIPANLHVTLYTANVCPFCPIVKRRLVDLQSAHGFDLENVDVTFSPEILRARRIRSLPVLEANGRTLIGNATSAQIADFLRAAAVQPFPTG
jgi:glutaredoxin